MNASNVVLVQSTMFQIKQELVVNQDHQFNALALAKETSLDINASNAQLELEAPSRASTARRSAAAVAASGGRAARAAAVLARLLRLRIAKFCLSA